MHFVFKSVSALGVLGALTVVFGSEKAQAGVPNAAVLVAGVTANRVAGARVASRSELHEAFKADEAVSSAQTLAAKEMAAELLPNRLELTAGTDGLVVLSDVSKQMSLFGEARYRFNRMLPLGGSIAYRFQVGNETSDTAFQLMVGPTFNFGTKSLSLGDAFFISPQIGITTGQTKFGEVVVNSNTQATLGLHVGKRFQIGESISYAPSIGVVKQWSFGPSFVVQPIALSLFF